MIKHLCAKLAVSKLPTKLNRVDMFPLVIAAVVSFWTLVFILTVRYKWGDVFRSLINIGFIQLLLLADLFPPHYVTPQHNPLLVTIVVTSAVSYNTGDIINMLRTHYVQTGRFIFHHTMVILGALLPVLCRQYNEVYIYGAMVEWTSIAYNINSIYNLGYIGQHWSEQHKKDAYTAYVLFYSIVRTIAIGMMFGLYYTERVLAPWWANVIYLTVTIGIFVFSVLSVFQMLGITTSYRSATRQRSTRIVRQHHPFFARLIKH